MQCAYNTTDFPRPSIFGLTRSKEYSFNNEHYGDSSDSSYASADTSDSSDTSDACFDRHATDEVKESIAMIGDYHMFLIDRAFKNQKDQVNNR